MYFFDPHSSYIAFIAYNIGISLVENDIKFEQLI